MQTYQIDTNNILAKWGKEEIEVKFSKWQVECTNALQAYQHDIQNEINRFNKETTIYQAEVQKVSQDSQSELTKDMNEYSSKMTRYQAELESYKALTNNQITEWTSKDIQVGMTEFTTKRNDELQKWNTENALALQKHTQEVQEEANKVNADLNVWNSEIQKAVTKFQAEDGGATALYQAKFQQEASRYDSDLKHSLEQYNSSINKLNTDVQRITELNQSRLGKANYDLQIWTGDSQNVLQEFTGLLTKGKEEFNYYINQYQTLKSEYDSSFIIQQNNKEQ